MKKGSRAQKNYDQSHNIQMENVWNSCEFYTVSIPDAIVVVYCSTV